MRLFFPLIFLIFINCQSENRDNSRAYVEGKISESKLPFSKISVKIIDNSSAIAETYPKPSGDFALSGPLFSDSFSLEFNTKIKSFSASKSGLEISADSLQIIVPAGISYISFTDIKLK